MERVRESVTRHLPPLRLYIEEVVELWTFISSISDPVALEVMGYYLDSPDEIADLPAKQTHDLRITSVDHQIAVWLESTGGTLWVNRGENDMEAVGIATRCEEILFRGKLRRPPEFLSSGWVGALISAPFWAGVFSRDDTVFGIGLAILAPYVALRAYDYRFQSRRYMTIIFRKRAEETSFWERNRDRLLLLLIGALLGVPVTLFAQWLGKASGLLE